MSSTEDESAKFKEKITNLEEETQNLREEIRNLKKTQEQKKWIHSHHLSVSVLVGIALAIVSTTAARAGDISRVESLRI